MSGYVKSKWVYGLIVLTVLAFIVWIIAGTSENENKNGVMVNQETYTMESSMSGNTEQSSGISNGYYIVKADNQIVKVYWIDGTGEHLHRETDIAYDLLSLEDQKMLDDGIKLADDGELESFLENYDS